MSVKMHWMFGQVPVIDDELAAFALELGAKDVQLNAPYLPGDKVWAFEDIKALKEKMAGYGLNLVAIENIPFIFYDKVVLGLDGRDEQIENYITTIRNLSRLDIRLFGHHFMTSYVWRTAMSKGRGGALGRAYDHSELIPDFTQTTYYESMKNKRNLPSYNLFEAAKGITADDLFANYSYFMKAVIPAAEECGVKLALHPDDPPVRDFAGTQKMITSVDDYKRAMKIADSPMWGLNLCCGCFSEMGGAETVKEANPVLRPAREDLLGAFQGCQGRPPAL